MVRYSVAGVTPSGTLFGTGATVVLTRLVGTHAGATGTVRLGDLLTAAKTVGLALCLWVSLPLNLIFFPWLTRSWLKRTMCSHSVGAVTVVSWA